MNLATLQNMLYIIIYNIYRIYSLSSTNLASMLIIVHNTLWEHGHLSMRLDALHLYVKMPYWTQNNSCTKVLSRCNSIFHSMGVLFDFQWHTEHKYWPEGYWILSKIAFVVTIYDILCWIQFNKLCNTKVMMPKVAG